MTEIRYGANGMPIKPKVITEAVAPVEAPAPKPKRKKKEEPLQEILEVNPNEVEEVQEDEANEEL